MKKVRLINAAPLFNVTPPLGSTVHGCTNPSTLEMEPKHLTKSDLQLNPIILRTKDDERVLQKTLG